MTRFLHSIAPDALIYFFRILGCFGTMQIPVRIYYIRTYHKKSNNFGLIPN